MKTVVIIDNSFGYTGAIKSALNQADLLSRKFRFVFVVPEKSSIISHILSSGYICYQLPMREINRSFLNILLYLPVLSVNTIRLRWILSKEKADYLQVNDFYNILGVTSKLSGYSGKLITCVRLIPSSMPRKLSRAWVLLAQWFSFKVIAVSDAVFRELKPRVSTLRIYNAICFPDNYPTKESMSANRTCRFLYLANYTRGKGQETAIRAFAEAYKVRADLRLDFYGGDMGLEKNRRFRDELEELVKDANLTMAIRLHGFAEDIERVIKSHDVLLNFSVAESFSMTCAEGSFYGVPVIATRSGGPDEIIEDGVTGFLLDKTDVSGITQKMLQLADSLELRNEMGKAAASRVRSMFTKDQFVEEMEKLVFT
jgi:glycosyltransferase involved in cell wall biosynthesis